MDLTDTKLAHIMDRAKILQNEKELVQRTYSLARFLSQITGVPEEKILGKRRTRQVSELRQILYYVLRKTGYSFPSIGFALGRDHTTIMYGVRKIKDRLKISSNNDLYRKIINDVIIFNREYSSSLVENTLKGLNGKGN